MAETLELQGVLEKLKKQGVEVQVEETSDNLFEVIDGTGNGSCSDGCCSGGSGFRSPESLFEDERMAA